MKINTIPKYLSRILFLAAALGLVFSALGIGAGLDRFQVAASCENPKECVEAGVNAGNPQNNQDSEEVINQTLGGVIEVIVIVSGIIAVIVFIIQGLRMITSGGNSETVSSARNGMIYAAIGIVIIITSRWIVLYILTRVGGGG